MAGVNPSAGTPVATQTVAPIGGVAYKASIGLQSGATPVAASAHLGDAMRAEGVAYDSNCVGQYLDTGAYPAGTAMTDGTPGDNIN